MKSLSANQKYLLGVGVVVATYLVYNKFINNGNDGLTSEPSLTVFEVPTQRKLIGKIRNSIRENNWVEYIDWVSSNQSIPTLRTLSDDDLKYLVSAFNKQPYELESKAKEILSRIGL